MHSLIITRTRVNFGKLNTQFPNKHIYHTNFTQFLNSHTHLFTPNTHHSYLDIHMKHINDTIPQ